MSRDSKKGPTLSISRFSSAKVTDARSRVVASKYSKTDTVAVIVQAFHIILPKKYWLRALRQHRKSPSLSATRLRSYKLTRDVFRDVEIDVVFEEISGESKRKFSPLLGSDVRAALYAAPLARWRESTPIPMCSCLGIIPFYIKKVTAPLP